MDNARCLQCPLNKAPECFKSTLVRALELGEDNFVPTNWRGFSDYFHLQALQESGAQCVVDAWANRHPCRQQHTILKVMEYARSTEHRKLLQSLEQVLKDHLVPEHMCTDDLTKCFTLCHKCSVVPSLLHRSNSRSTDDLHKQRHSTGSVEGRPPHRHRRTHSLPDHICKCKHCSESHGHNSITNIYHVSWCCQNNPMLPPAMPVTSHTPSSLSFVPLPLQGEALRRLVATESAPTSPFADSKTNTFDIPTLRANTEPHCSKQARHGHVCCPGHSTPHPRKLLKHTCSSAEIERSANWMSGSSSQFCQGGACLNCVLGRSSVGEGVVGRGGEEEEEEKEEEEEGAEREGEMDKVEEDRRGRNGGGGGGEGGGGGGGERDGDRGRVHKEREAAKNETSEGRDIMQEFGRRLFDTPPYNLMQRFYNSSTREVIILLFASFFMYNGLRAILQTICESGGLRAIFIDMDAALVEATRRFVIFLLRILNVVISPLCVAMHISAIAAKPRIPKTTFKEAEAIGRMFRVHRRFSPHYEVQFLQTQAKSIFRMSEVMTKRHINSIWMSVVNALLFIFLLIYLGVVKFTTKEVMKAGVCQFLVTTVYLPVLQENVHGLVLLDSALTLLVVLSTFTLKDYYYYENRIAIFSVTVGGEAEKLYREIRRRWLLLDLSCYLTAGGLIGIALTLASLQRTIIPDPTSPLQPKDLLNWVFWTSVIAVVSFLGKSSNRLVKKASLVAYLLVVLLIGSVNLQIETIPPETINVFFVIFLFNLILNFLLSLCSCHLHHYNCTESWKSLLLLLLSISLILLLPLAVLWIIYREVVHLAAFVQW